MLATVQIAENRELGASMLHKTEVKTCTNVHGILPKGQYLFHSHSMILFLMSRQSTWQVNGVVMDSISYCEIAICACVSNTNSNAHVESGIPRETRADI